MKENTAQLWFMIFNKLFFIHEKPKKKISSNLVLELRRVEQAENFQLIFELISKFH